MTSARGGYGRNVCFADRSVRVETDAAATVAIIDAIFRDVDDRSKADSHCLLRIEDRNADWRLLRHTLPGDQVSDPAKGSDVIYEGASLGDLGSALVGESIFNLCDRCDSGLVFHAAAVTRDGVTVALPASSGSGKTTLAAWLVKRGWRYLTDELVHVPLGTDRINAFTRPYNFKRPAFQLIADEFGIDVNADYAITGSIASLIPHRHLAKWQPLGRAPTLTHVIFPRFDAADSPDIRALTPARAGLSLMQCLVNARNLPNHGFNEVGRLTRRVRAWSLTYRDYGSAEALLDPVLSAAGASLDS